MSPDPYGINDEQAAKKEFDDYELPQRDRNSINEIRKKIEKEGYKELGEITNHQEFLEDMTNRLRLIMQNEKELGGINWELERQVDDIKALYFELERMRKTKAKKKR